MAVTGNETATYTFGYGAPSGGTGNTSFKMPYSNETISPSPGTNLYSGKSAASAFCPRNGGITSFPSGDKERWFDSSSGTPNASYTGCGMIPGITDKVYKSDYSAETQAELPSSSLPGSRYNRGTLQSITVGYWFSGYNPGYSTTNNCDKLIFATETAAAVPGVNMGSAAFQEGNPGTTTAGYASGGSMPGPERSAHAGTNMNKLTYSSETSSVIPGAVDHHPGHNPPKNLTNGGGTSDGTNGYWFWGEDGGWYDSYVEKLSLIHISEPTRPY